MTHRPSILLLVALATLAACGDDALPSNTAARIGKVDVQRGSLHRWSAAALGEKPVFDPPRFRRCAASVARGLRDQAGRKVTVPPPAQLQEVCRSNYRRVRQEVMRSLIGATWIRAEARARGMSVSRREVAARIRSLRRGRVPDLGGFRLAWTGVLPVDDPHWARMTLLAEKLYRAVLRGTPSPSRADVARYYNRNRARYAVPARRDVLVVETKTRAQAVAARRMLEDGASFGSVVRRWSVDQSTNRRGGRLRGLTRGARGAAVDRVVFSARRGELVGPVATPLGYGVFKVIAIHRPRRRSLARAAPAIRRELLRNRREAAWEQFVRRLSKRWRPRTRCAPEVAVAECRNAPGRS